MEVVFEKFVHSFNSHVNTSKLSVFFAVFIGFPQEVVNSMEVIFEKFVNSFKSHVNTSKLSNFWGF